MSSLDATWEERHTLADGTPVVLRPLRPADAGALREGYSRLSASSRYTRFLGALPELSDEQLRRLTEVDGDTHVAIVAVVESLDLKSEHGLGVGRFIRLPDDPAVAETALTVLDAHQGRGLGKLLLSALVRIAASRGVRNFRAEVLAGNAAVLGLLASVGAVERPGESDEEVRVYDIPIPSVDEAGGSRWQALYLLLRHASVSAAQVFRQWWVERPR